MSAARSDELRVRATEFRKAIEFIKSSQDYRGTWFDRFPNECNLSVYTFLFAYLFKYGFRWFMRVTAKLPPKHEWHQITHHHWLEVEDTILDIAADRFSDGNPSVIVCESSQFHDLLTDRTKSPMGDGTEAEQTLYERVKEGEYDSDGWYKVILSHIKPL